MLNGTWKVGSTLDMSFHFDSSLSDYMPVKMSGTKNWVGIVTYVKFILDNDVEYTDFTAYLQIKMSNLLANSCLTQNAKKAEGSILPIRDPGGRNAVDIPIKGVYSGEDELNFSILDKNLVLVPTARLVVTMRVFSDKGEILII